MSDQPSQTNIDAGDAEQVVVNTAPDGGGVDNNEAPDTQSDDADGGDEA